MSVEVLSGKVFLLVTGASRGIGRQIAITFGSLLEEGSRVLLLARNKDKLQEVANNIPSKVKVYTVSTDLSKSNNVKFEGKLKFLFSKSSILIYYVNAERKIISLLYPRIHIGSFERNYFQCI